MRTDLLPESDTMTHNVLNAVRLADGRHEHATQLHRLLSLRSDEAVLHPDHPRLMRQMVNRLGTLLPMRREL